MRELKSLNKTKHSGTENKISQSSFIILKYNNPLFQFWGFCVATKSIKMNEAALSLRENGLTLLSHCRCHRSCTRNGNYWGKTLQSPLSLHTCRRQTGNCALRQRWGMGYSIILLTNLLTTEVSCPIFHFCGWYIFFYCRICLIFIFCNITFFITSLD